MSESLTSELWLKIDQLHLKYLQSEDTPAKLDIRKKLEGELFIVRGDVALFHHVPGLVAEYLSIVPQHRKFVNPITGDIVANSAKWKPDFSLVKAANAFRAIEQYAANLINQPWRLVRVTRLLPSCLSSQTHFMRQSHNLFCSDRSSGVSVSIQASTSTVWRRLCSERRSCSWTWATARAARRR